MAIIGTVSSGWRSQNAEDADKLSQAIATQILIWETVVGERDEILTMLIPEAMTLF